MPKTKNAVEVRDIKKSFYLRDYKNDSLKRAITQAFKKKDKGGNIFNALDGVSFNVKKGDFFGILGRNGSGKSTLLKIISEIYQPTSGSVKHDGKVVSFIELGVGFKAELSGRENVYLNGALLGFSKKEVEAMYDDIVAFAELEKFMDQRLKNYSSGMKVRLAFSVAIRAKADILILDEVLAVGDAAFQRKCNDYFRTLKTNGKTVILVTHSMGAVREYCDRAVLINEGKITKEGNAEEVADEYLKLFNEPAKDNKETLNTDRWGSREVFIDTIDVNVSQETISIDVDLKSGDKAVEGVKFGFRLKDQQGKLLAGANNLNVTGARKMNFKAYETKNLHFSMPNILGNQTYSLSATVNLSDGITTYDNWDNITTLNNTKNNVHYPLLYPATLTIKDNE